MSSSDDDTELPQHLKDQLANMKDSDDSEEEQPKKQEISKNNQSQDKQKTQEEQTQEKQDQEQKSNENLQKSQEKSEIQKQLEDQGETLKQKGLSTMELLKQKTQQSKEKIKNLSELKKNPENKKEFTSQLIKDVKEAKKDVDEIKSESQNLQKETIGAAGAVIGSIKQAQQEEKKEENSQNQEQQEKKEVKEKRQRQKGALQYQLTQSECQQRRKDAQFILKEWDDKCQEYYNLHKQIADAAFSRLERRFKLSVESMKSIIVYFQNKAQFELNYYKSHTLSLPKLGMAFKDLQDSNTIMYPVLTQGFQMCDDMNEQQSKQILIFAQYIEKNILKDMLIYDGADFEKKLGIIIDKIKRCKEKIKVVSKEYNQASQKYQKVYHDLISTEEKAKNKDKDFYNNELKFKKAALEYMEAQKDYGVTVWKFWAEIKKLETHRLDTLQRAFKQYLEKYKITYGELPSINLAQETWTKFDPKDEGEKNFTLNAILNQEDINNLKKGLKKSSDSQITLEDCEFYLSKFTISELDKYSKLVLQTFLMERDVGAMKKQFKQSELVVTIDDFLLFFDDPKDEEIHKANKKLHMNKVSVKRVKEKPADIYIIEKIPGLVINTSNKILVRFEDEEQMDEFVGYVAKFNEKK